METKIMADRICAFIEGFLMGEFVVVGFVIIAAAVKYLVIG